MNYLNLFGQNGEKAWKVSQISLGCDYYGLEVPEEQAFRIMDAYYDKGGNFLDTAHVYGQKVVDTVSFSEVTVGKWVEANKLQGKVVISDKGAHPDRRNMQVSRLTYQNARNDLFSSLEALKTDCVDIWFLHRDNPAMPVSEIVDMVSEFVDKGYIKKLGASNWTSKRLQAANDYARENGKHGFSISQIQWSLAISTPESWNDPTLVCMDDAQQEWYQEKQFPVMVFSPQARGLFSKVIQNGVDSLSEKVKERFLLDKNLGRIEKCRQLSERLHMNPAGVCLSYLTSAQFPVIPVIGCSSPEQVVDSLRSADDRFSESDRRFLVE